MSSKDAVLELVRGLPDDATLVEIEILAAIRRGIEDVDRGNVVPHGGARRRIEAWLPKSNGPTRSH